MTDSIAHSSLPYLCTRTDVDELYDSEQFELRVYQPPESMEVREQQAKVLNAAAIAYEQRMNKKPKMIYRMGISQFDSFFVWKIVRKEIRNNALLINQKSQRPQYTAISVDEYDRHVKKARQLAMRTLYTLGYDIGVVDVGLFSHEPRYRILRITDQTPNSVIDNLNQMIENQRLAYERKTDPMLGADLEFILRHESGRYMLASNFLSRMGRVGYDAIWIPQNRGKHPIAELRPPPHRDPLALLKSIYSCLLLAKKKINRSDVYWLAGGQPLKGFPIGGHLHFSDLPLSSRFVRSLDSYLTLPLFLMESDISLTRRPKYGFLGDVRKQFHGGFEYRTPPSWLVRPRIARGILCLSRVLALDYKKLVWFPTLSADVQLDFYDGDQKQLRPLVSLLWEELRYRCPSYNTYHKELDRFYQLIESGYRWDEYEDIRPYWRINSS